MQSLVSPPYSVVSPADTWKGKHIQNGSPPPSQQSETKALETECLQTMVAQTHED